MSKNKNNRKKLIFFAKSFGYSKNKCIFAKIFERQTNNNNKKKKDMNAFTKANIMGAGANGARTENGAISYATIGNALLDQFAKAGTARGRDIKTVWAEQGQLWAEDPNAALKFPFYLRMITRQTNIGDGKKTEKVQKGQGAKDEAFKRLLWIAKFHPEAFYRNLWLVPVVGSWKDLWVLLTMDDSLDKTEFFKVIAEGIEDEGARDLVKKYLPRIRSEKKCTSEWAKKTNALAKEFAKAAGWTYEDYRVFKSTGKAHEFQKAICGGRYKDINWNAVPGKALLSLVSGKFLENHKLSEDYLKWLKNQPVAKFNGYVYELGLKLGDGYQKVSNVAKITIDKQFDGLIATASKDSGAINGNVLCALDTSGSMNAKISGGPEGLTSYGVCVSLGIYFSELNKGAFHNTVAMFDSTSKMMTLSGTFSDKWYQIRKATTAWGSTNFQSLIDLICDTRRIHPEIPLEDFPKTLLVVSDMQFNPTSYGYGSYGRDVEQTNYRVAMQKLAKYFPAEFVEDFKIVWWYCAGRPTKDFPSTMDDKQTYMFSGFDGAVVSFLLGGDGFTDPQTGAKVQPTMVDIVNAALGQEALSLIQ